MSEKQFVLYEHKGNYYILQNPRLHLDFIEMLGDALTDEEIVDLLNEQQATINKLQELAAELGATLLMNGFEIEINGKDLNELIKDERKTINEF